MTRAYSRGDRMDTWEKYYRVYSTRRWPAQGGNAGPEFRSAFQAGWEAHEACAAQLRHRMEKRRQRARAANGTGEGHADQV